MSRVKSPFKAENGSVKIAYNNEEYFILPKYLLVNGITLEQILTDKIVLEYKTKELESNLIQEIKERQEVNNKVIQLEQKITELEKVFTDYIGKKVSAGL